ncbi:MAG: Wzz/FepE/Etk N-terminal domain-containing protein [Ginsengibacter sp.]
MTSQENGTFSEPRNPSESIIINKLIRSIFRKWWLFLLIGLVGAVAGYLYALSHKTQYQSYLSFALDEGGSNGGSSAMGLAAQFGISLGGSQSVFTGDNILEIIESRRMIEGTLLAVDTFDNKPMTLIEFYLENENPVTTDDHPGLIKFYPGQPRSEFSYGQDSVLYNTYLKFKTKNIIARKPDKRLNIYEVMVTSHNEKFSKDFTEKLIEQTNSFYTEIRSKKAGETLEILEKRVPDMKQKLDASIANKAAIQDANLNTPLANAEVPLLKQQTNAQVYSAAYGEMFKNLEVARFQYLQSIPLLQIIDAPNYPMRKIKPGKLKMAVVFAVLSGFILLISLIIINLFKESGISYRPAK